MTHIDRINYYSDGYIEYYKKFFELEEFYFLIHSHFYDDIVKYLKKNGFKDDQMTRYVSTSYIALTKTSLQNGKNLSHSVVPRLLEVLTDLRQKICFLQL